MCGITGLVNYDRQRPVDPEILARMNEVIRHRGPDSDGFYLQKPVGLAIRRLAVIDLVAGDQPISNEDGSVWLVFNGEIYNYQELRSRLERIGHRFRTHSDTETIVHLYEEYGTACVDSLRGMFAFALWDQPRARLLLARDRLGKKPLYYAEHDGALLFGSELKCLLQYPEFPRRPDLTAIDLFLALQYVPDPLGAFQGVQKLPAAHRLVWEAGKIQIERYWELNYEPKIEEPIAQLEEELLKRLEEAVRIRLVSDVPLGVHLSGGIDSSVVTALAAKRTSRPIKTFSMGFEEERFSELPYARLVAEMYGTEHHEFVVRFGDIPLLIRKLVRQFDEPFADPSAIPVYLLAQRTREHVTVALNGDGGDELFAGYIRYGLDRYAGAYARLPSLLGQKLFPALLTSVRQPLDRPGEENWLAGVKRLAQAARTTQKANFLRWGSYFSSSMKAQLWKDELASGFETPQTPTEQWLSDIFDRAPADSSLDRTLYVDTTTYLPGDLLVKADRMTMAHSLEARSPFLDHDFQSWAARLPSRYKWNGKIHKYLLKRACAKLLPARLLARGKQGFGIPLGAWIQGPLRQWVQELLLNPDARIGAYLKRDSVQHLFEEHLRGRESHANRLWALVMLEVWLQEYL
jgi:asparagine synthase (glutamine-hydrolysing)